MAAIALWCLVEWLLLRQPMIAGDWVGWRESDTQAIARHLTEPGARSFLYPRIDWGGAGPGYVETEMMLYPAIVAMIMRVVGVAEWPGQLVSLLSIAGAAWVLFGALARAYGDRPALVGLVAFLVSPVLAFVGSSVQPEALCLLGFVVAWAAFLRWEADGRTRDLVIFAAVGGLAMCVKPTAAQLGVASFVVLAARSRQRLRQVPIWIAWAAMVGALAIFMWHAHNLFVEYGNTFGVLSGGDSKVPKLRHLLMPRVYLRATATVVMWGFGIVGGAAFIAALRTRRADATLWALLAANVLWTIMAMRYVCNPSWGGIHYTIVSAVLAAHAAAAVTPRPDDSARRTRLTWLGGVVFLLGALAFDGVMRRRSMVPNEEAQQVIAMGQKLAEIAAPDDLVVVRSSRFSFDPFWNTPNNFQDPRVFYVANRRGWVLGSDETDPEVVGALAKKGARFYVEPGHGYVDTPIDDWLSAHASLVGTTPLGGRVFRLGT